ncbi:hypothetical protein KIW84_014090 [Lathyrus oleraceus]|uniref:Uncharacterized protein n=1 Tax=Pisum sativum TaxID=3888 RepID=A0A9D5BLU7_PEA|nr:hypothetical protein KIW84_014090 [Pisum sativum]
MSVARNMIKNPKLVLGGGAAEMTVSAALKQKSSSIEGIEKWPYEASACQIKIKKDHCFGMGQGDNKAEEHNITTNLDFSPPGKKSKSEGFAGLDNWDLSNEENDKLVRNSPARNQLSVFLNKLCIKMKEEVSSSGN